MSDMWRHTTVHRAPTRLEVFTKAGGASNNFTAFKYGDDADSVSVFLTPEQTRALAEQFAAAVAAFDAGEPVPTGPAEAVPIGRESMV